MVHTFHGVSDFVTAMLTRQDVVVSTVDVIIDAPQGKVVKTIPIAHDIVSEDRTWTTFGVYVGSTCMSLSIFMPLNPTNYVPYAHIDDLLYKSTLETCLRGMDHDLPWGTVLLQLAVDIARKAGCWYVTLSDASYVYKCGGQKVPFSRYNRLKGKLPWYEQHGFIPKTREFSGVKSTFMTNAQRQLEDHTKYLTKLQKCRASKDLRDVCLGCMRIAPGETCSALCQKSNAEESGKYLIDLVDQGHPRACNYLKKIRGCYLDFDTTSRIHILEPVEQVSTVETVAHRPFKTVAHHHPSESVETLAKRSPPRRRSIHQDSFVHVSTTRSKRLRHRPDTPTIPE